MVLILLLHWGNLPYLLWVQPVKGRMSPDGNAPWGQGEEFTINAPLMLVNKGGRELFLMTMPCGMNCLTFILLGVFHWANELPVIIPIPGFLWDTGSAP